MSTTTTVNAAIKTPFLLLLLLFWVVRHNPRCHLWRCWRRFLLLLLLFFSERDRPSDSPIDKTGGDEKPYFWQEHIRPKIEGQFLSFYSHGGLLTFIRKNFYLFGFSCVFSLSIQYTSLGCFFKGDFVSRRARRRKNVGGGISFFFRMKPPFSDLFLFLRLTVSAMIPSLFEIAGMHFYLPIYREKKATYLFLFPLFSSFFSDWFVDRSKQEEGGNTPLGSQCFCCINRRIPLWI